MRRNGRRHEAGRCRPHLGRLGGLGSYAHQYAVTAVPIPVCVVSSSEKADLRAPWAPSTSSTAPPRATGSGRTSTPRIPKEWQRFGKRIRELTGGDDPDIVSSTPAARQSSARASTSPQGRHDRHPRLDERVDARVRQPVPWMETEGIIGSDFAKLTGRPTRRTADRRGMQSIPRSRDLPLEEGRTGGLRGSSQRPPGQGRRLALARAGPRHHDPVPARFEPSNHRSRRVGTVTALTIGRVTMTPNGTGAVPWTLDRGRAARWLSPGLDGIRARGHRRAALTTRTSCGLAGFLGVDVCSGASGFLMARRPRGDRRSGRMNSRSSTLAARVVFLRHGGCSVVVVAAAFSATPRPQAAPTDALIFDVSTWWYILNDSSYFESSDDYLSSSNWSLESRSSCTWLPAMMTDRVAGGRRAVAMRSPCSMRGRITLLVQKRSPEVRRPSRAYRHDSTRDGSIGAACDSVAAGCSRLASYARAKS